ncbi:hypothetical protein [Fuscovulum ytuae]|uniref:Uncharacterized protein n=1 Tax=Fuscovulum ytuae TaxID=3042299 RepID=A0ABY8Q533_9RHOB|nr:hypothetical protein [Fuscovulum sp. YMD61]WGV15980.1 hypothetical protein QF092_17270 [Fuscovulum sp. YMD61]WGV17348.1 hypothetical protein QF092_06020 [Fuscovulum sp. YMD61]WGV18363.1 hypothetical protein QF092_19965 [Fuscovulum sp. YMD61]
MEIKTKHRKSAEANKPKGRALFTLAERKEAPFAAMFAALTLTLAAYVKTAFGGTAQPSDPTDQPVDRQAAEQVSAPRHPGMEEAAPPVEFAELDEGQPLITGSLPGEDGDMGRIGRGPGQLDLSRFFPDADPTMDMPDLYLADRPEIATAALPSMFGTSGSLPLIPGAPGGGAGGGTGGSTGGGAPGNTAGTGTGGNGPGGNGPGGNGTGTGEDDATGIVGISFQDLFAQLASVVRPFHATTVRDISNLAIGDWVSQHELYKLRGGETRPDLDTAYLAREERTYDLVSNPESKAAFIEEYFPSLDTPGNSTMPEASLAEGPVTTAFLTANGMAGDMSNDTGLQPDPLLATDSVTGLL